MNIRSNVPSLFTRTALSKSAGQLALAIERLSSGKRVNSAKDDAAGAGIVNRMTSRVRGVDMASRNAQDAISLLQTAQSTLDEINNNLQRVRELTVQGLSDTLTTADKASIQREIDDRLYELERLAKAAKFNGQSLLNEDKDFAIQVGAGSSDTLSFSLKDIDLWKLGLTTEDGQYLIDDALGKNPLKVSPPIEEDFLPAFGDTFKIGKVRIKVDAATPYLEHEAAAAHFGVPPEQLTVHKPLDPATGLPLSNYYVIKVSESYYLETANGFYIDPVTNDAIVQLNPRTDLFYTDPENGITTPTQVVGDRIYAQVGLTDDGRVVQFYEFQGKQFERSAWSTGMILSGPDANNVNISFRMPATEDPLGKVDEAIRRIDEMRSYLGAVENRFGSVISTLAAEKLNMTAARSRTEDADYAHEVSTMTRGQILQQAAQAVLAQATQMPSMVLKLLQS